MSKLAFDGNGLPWNNLLCDKSDFVAHVEDTLRTESLDFSAPYDKSVAPDLELSVEAQVMMGVLWCEAGRHWVSKVEDDVCDVCWQQMLDETA